MAIEARFGAGVFLIPLVTDTLSAPDQPSESLVEALAVGLRVDVSGPVHPQAQLLSYLRDKELLLILDNFEYMTSQARQLADVLRLTPKVKVLVTSRVRLNLQQEELIEVKGLDVPATAEAVADPAFEYSAIKLFLQQARRVQSGFTLAAGERAAVIRICQLVEGAPLGIELAASWLRVLTCAEIVAEIEKGLDFLTTNWQNVPERHRSLRAVFDYSWNLLAPPEQAAFAKLAVFHGGFQREAAAQVADASLPLLADMVDKSLLRRAATGRYELHDLLRHFAEEKLRADEGLYAQVHNAHCRYYAELMAQHRAELQDDDVSAPLTELNAERENVRAAWNWAVSQRRVEELNILMDCL
jgi:predicted ATPase